MCERPRLNWRRAGPKAWVTLGRNEEQTGVGKLNGVKLGEGECILRNCACIRDMMAYLARA